MEIDVLASCHKSHIEAGGTWHLIREHAVQSILGVLCST